MDTKCPSTGCDPWAGVSVPVRQFPSATTTESEPADKVRLPATAIMPPSQLFMGSSGTGRITALLVPIVYLFYSVARYFTFRRALGIDHFDPSYRTKPLERRGIFRFTRNGMYTFGLLVVWLPGLYAASKAALLAALFHHASIWVHYACTELPDMRRLYGAASLGAEGPSTGPA